MDSFQPFQDSPEKSRFCAFRPFSVKIFAQPWLDDATTPQPRHLFILVSGDRNSAVSGFGESEASPLAQLLLHPLHATDNLQHNLGPADNVAPLLGLGNNQFGMRPLVALLDGRDCAIEMSLLKDVATVAFCDAQNPSEIHDRVLNEAVVALAYHSIQLDKEDLMKFKRLKAIIRIGPSTGNIDIETASDRGIAICNTKAECIEEQSDTTLSLMLNLYRKTYIFARSSRNQGIEGLKEVSAGTKRLHGSSLLIVGLGNVGKAVALRAKAFGFKITFYDPNISEGMEKALDINRCLNLEEALANADCVTFHCPVNVNTKNIINAQNLKRMKKGVYIVNIISEKLLVESDVLTGLRNGQIGGIALDLNTKNESLSAFPNVIYTPRMSWYSDQSCRELREAAALEARRVLKGEDPFQFHNCVNKKMKAAAEPALPSTSVAPNVTSIHGIPPFSSTNNFLGFPNCLVNTPMMMWPTNFVSEKPVFGNISENQNDDRRAVTSGLHEDRPSISPTVAKEDSKNDKSENDYKNGTNASKEEQNSHGEDNDSPPMAKICKLEEQVKV
uniref:2-Hacid_dh_C domain-containing protein n=1 Tax=Bursaphelenchus xylophilus TaxID=6326 RepID=A0A1I7STG4_BURXY